MIFFYFVVLVMVSVPRKCPSVEGKVCGHFLPSKEHNPHHLFVASRGKSCHPDDRCYECHEWLEDCCKSVSAYMEKLSLQREREDEVFVVFFFQLLPVYAGAVGAALVC